MILKKLFFRDFCKFSKKYGNLQQLIKSDVFDTNARRENDFQVENTPIGTIVIDFRSMGTHFIDFSVFLVPQVIKLFQVIIFYWPGC